MNSHLDERGWPSEGPKITHLLDRATPFASVNVPQVPRVPRVPRKVAFTGVLGVGKDWVAEKWKLKRIGLADPLYAFAEHLLGTSDKTVPGVRKFLQDFGQWGRGFVSEEVPLSPTRALTVREARKFFADCPSWRVVPEHLGQSPDVWVNSLLVRASVEPGDVAVTNVRFQNELDALRAAGFEVFHVSCSPETLKTRREAVGYGGYPPELLRGVSEHLALSFDGRFANAHPGSPFEPLPEWLKVVWNDSLDNLRTASIPVILL